MPHKDHYLGQFVKIEADFTSDGTEYSSLHDQDCPNVVIIPMAPENAEDNESYRRLMFKAMSVKGKDPFSARVKVIGKVYPNLFQDGRVRISLIDAKIVKEY